MPHNKCFAPSAWTAMAAQPRAMPATLHVHPLEDPMRARIETYIHQRYQQRFGARLTEWLPTLVSVQRDGEILAAAGYRSASDPLFLERYLSAPIEQYLRDHGAPVARSLIVEAGQFAAVRPGGGRLLVPLLARHLHAEGFDWAVSTLTIELHHLFRRMGLAHQPISAATSDHLNEAERKDWGNYYAHAPTVFAGRLNAILGRLPEMDV